MTEHADALRQKQIAQAEELFFSGPERAGFAKDLFAGKFRAGSMLPYPQLSADEQRIGDEAVAEVRRFAEEHIDAAAIDREADIPQEVIRGLGDLGVLGMTVAPEHGGRGFSQQNYCRVMEVVGGHCGSTAVFVNAHHSIGLRALELFGTEEQKRRWMRPLAAGEQLAAFALTEPEAGSDAGNVQTRAEPAGDRDGYILNGQKRYITNGALAGVLTVMARTPDERDAEGKITAFLVTPDMPGFEVVEARMEKLSIRGTATARLAFHDMFVPRENVLGPVGKGLRVALTVLDFGRTTFGASCTGMAKRCVELSVAHARERRQFGRALGEFEMIREKIARMAALTLAMESATYHTAAVIDSGADDYMLETAMLKVFASDALWEIVDETLQIHGGAGFFTDRPIERMFRDARLNLVGEGANEVLRSFIAMAGLRSVGLRLQELLKKPWKAAGMLVKAPRIPIPPPANHRLVMRDRMQRAAGRLSKQIAQFARTCRNSLVRHREEILERQLVHSRLGDVAMELFVASCVYSRLATAASQAGLDEEILKRDLQTGLYFLKTSHRRNQQRLRAVSDHLDADTNATAAMWL